MTWKVCIEHAFAYTGGEVTLTFAYKNETEENFDFSTVYVDTTGNGADVEVVSYTGVAAGTANLSLSQGIELPEVVPAPIKIKFCFMSEGAWSDQDGLFATDCGAFALDDVSVNGEASRTPRTSKHPTTGGYSRRRAPGWGGMDGSGRSGGPSAHDGHLPLQPGRYRARAVR